MEHHESNGKPSGGWLDGLPDNERDIITRAFLDAVTTYRSVGDEQIVSQMAAGYGDAHDASEALIAFRGLAASLRRIEVKYGDAAASIERIIAVMDSYFREK
jgi:hypothetical protein